MVSSRVPFQWKNGEEVPLKVPFHPRGIMGEQKCDQVPSSVR